MKTLLLVFGCCYFVVDLVAQNLSEIPDFERFLVVEQTRRFPYTGKLNLSQNYPNPFVSTESTTIPYRAVDVIQASFILYNLQGKRILIAENLKEDVGEIKVEGSSLSPGTYVYALIVNGRIIDKKKMMVY